MIGHNWSWGEIVNPRLVEQAMVAEEQRARRRANNDSPVDRERDRRPISA